MRTFFVTTDTKVNPMPLKLTTSHHLLLSAYTLAWVLAPPLLSRSTRTGPGLARRKAQPLSREPVDIWIQAASSGEAALTAAILSEWPQDRPLTILATTNTPQGMEILKQIDPPGKTDLRIRYCPLDRIGLIERHLYAVRPKLVVLLETELWPGLLAACRKNAIPVLLLNGRMTPKSLARYLLLRDFWQALAPKAIAAVDEREARRYQTLFPRQQVRVIPNIKFDRCKPEQSIDYAHNPLASIIKPQTKLVVLGSIRRQEEQPILAAIRALLNHRPSSIIALFPRHLNRITAWQDHLDKKGVAWVLRSTVTHPVKQGTVILWDIFGELVPAYALAGCAFVGGSLAPLGGQNFLEPLAQGILPCIGPSWNNFFWVGRDIFKQGLVTQIQTGEELPEALLQILKSAPPRETIRDQFQDYIRNRQGGTRLSIEAMLSYFSER